MSIIHNKNSGKFSIDCDYQINRVYLEETETEHTHGFVELVYTLTGKGIHKVNGREFHIKSGDMLVVNYNCRHEVIPQENLLYVDIMLKPEYFEESLRGTEDIFLILRLREFEEFTNTVIRDNILLHFDSKEQARAESLLEWTWEEQTKGGTASELILKSALSLVLSLVFKKMTVNRDGHFSVNDMLLSYIHRNCAAGISVSELAHACGYSNEHFSRIFKKYTGRTPSDYITECKLKNAERLIVSTGRSIEDIISECGFSDKTAFYKKFSQRYGCSPLKLRKNQNQILFMS